MQKKIAFIINSLETGGAEKTVALLLNSLGDDWEMHLLMFNTTTIEFDIPSSVKIYQIGKPTSSEARAIEVLKLPLQALQIKKYLKKNGIGLVFSFLNRPNFIAGYLKVLGFEGKIIINERSNTSYYYTNKTIGGRLGRFLVKKLYSRADCVITNSVFSRKELQERFGLKNRIISINNGINYVAIQEQLKDTIPPFAKKPGEFVFCHVGRYHPDKNQQLLFHAFAQLKNMNCRLMVIGKDIPLHFELLVKQLGIEDAVLLLDRRTDLPRYYAMADTFVLTSNVEGYPNVLLEAMACNLPIIATDCKWGPREILAPGTDYPANFNQIEYARNGILVPVNDMLLLATAMKNMMNRTIQDQYEQNSRLAIRDFDQHTMLQLFVETLNAIEELGA